MKGDAVTNRAGSRRQNRSADSLAIGLGWFSIALGVAELVAPRTLGRALGMEEKAGVLQAYGLREIATGVGILTSQHPGPWLWGRVAGDGLDLATLACSLSPDNPKRGNVGVAMGAVLGVTLLDIYAARQRGGGDRRPPRDYSDRSGFPETPDKMRGKAPNPPPQYIPNKPAKPARPEAVI